MSLAVAIALVAVLDVVVLAALAYVMSAPRKLTPHVPAWIEHVEAEFRQEAAELLGHDSAPLHADASLA